MCVSFFYYFLFFFFFFLAARRKTDGTLAVNSVCQKKNTTGPQTMSLIREKLKNRICRQIQDLHASFGIEERRKHKGCSRSCTYTLFLPYGVEIKLIFALRAAVSETLAEF